MVIDAPITQQMNNIMCHLILAVKDLFNLLSSMFPHPSLSSLQAALSLKIQTAQFQIPFIEAMFFVYIQRENLIPA